jgi:hypothetical protein
VIFRVESFSHQEKKKRYIIANAMEPISKYIGCIDQLETPYPAQWLSDFLDGYSANFTRETTIDDILFDGKRGVDVRVVEGERMGDDQIRDMLRSLVKGHPPTSSIVRTFKKVGEHLIKGPESVRRQGEDLRPIVRSVNSQLSIMKFDVQKIEEGDVIEIAEISGIPISTLATGGEEANEFVLDVWLEYVGVGAIGIEYSTWYATLLPSKPDDLGAYVRDIASRLRRSHPRPRGVKFAPGTKKPTTGKYRVYRFSEPSLPITKRWIVGISASSSSYGDVKKIVKMVALDERVYMIKVLNPDYSTTERSHDVCSKAQIYVEVDAENLQPYIDELHRLVPKTLAEAVMPKECSIKPPFTTNIPELQAFSSTAEAQLVASNIDCSECIFTFTQGDDETVTQREEMDDVTLRTTYDGPHHYKLFGTVDVAIDLVAYRRMMSRIANAEKEMYGRTPKDAPQYPLRKTFTDLLFTRSMSAEMAIKVVAGTMPLFDNSHLAKKKRSGLSDGPLLLHGIDSQYGEVKFVMRPRVIEWTTEFTSIGSRSTIREASKEAEHFTFRDPIRAADGVCDKRDDYSWCNMMVESQALDLDLSDVDVVLVPRYLRSKIIAGGIAPPLANRIVYYGSDNADENYSVILSDDQIYKSIRSTSIARTLDEAMGRPADHGLFRTRYGTRLPKIALSYPAFVDAQARYMERLAYYGMFVGAIHVF